ncbi:receptor-type tyrosine-protein phosphatase mu-like isoform X1 [Lytechinus pictus]|uniref:receptor-type tyrosine-protein phosphatase mu-like isoform X1 n=2 Tax=Lytechinus pictus TaxID=7653 RepID=UPI0030BA1011
MLLKFSDHGNTWHTDGFGPFYCEAAKAARDVTRVTTFFQRSDAKFIPSDGVFTKTVNVNDTGVVISMTNRYQPDDNGNVITWRKDGGDVLTQFDGQTNISFPNPIQMSDQGIYEIYYDDERHQNRGGIYRLIVRECPAGRWGPPDCDRICDNCYNGGVCDDKSGLCICPNNFMGKHCLEICREDGGNRFGLNCNFRCSYRSADGSTWCHGNLFCLPDPYGCSCDVGAHGHECNTPCDVGTYGPGCSQTCHCANVSSCDPFSGICTTGGCQSGWSGNNCQKCEGGRFGLDCLQQCHCAPEACEKQTGLCKGQCIDGWIEPYCQRISRYEVLRVNPYQPSNITCYAEGIPIPDASSVDLRRRIDTNTYNITGITKQSSSVLGSERAVVFDIESVYPPEDGEYVCGLIVKDQFYPTSITNATYVLPVIRMAPSIVSSTSSTVSLRWNAWSAGKDIGDPPLIGYDVFVRKDGNWEVDQRVADSSTSATVSNLTPDTDYMFRVAAVREGEGGTGPWSPRNETITLCTAPRSPPTGILVTANNPKELKVTWKFLSLESANCRSGVTHYMIYYALSGSSSTNSSIVSNDTRSYTISGLETYLDYTIQISASNKDEEGDKSRETTGKTLEEVAPPPINLSIPTSTTSTFTVTWSTPIPANLNGDIQKYVIRYQQTDPPTADNYTLEEDTDSVLEYTVEGLQAETNYSVQVQTVNRAGSSDWSERVNAKTIKSGVTPGPAVAPIVGGVMGAFIIIALVVILIFGILRKRRNQEEQNSMPNNKTNGVPAVIYENQEIVDQNKACDSFLYDNVAIEKDTYLYEGVDIVPATGSTSKPAIQPRVESKNVNGKPVAVVRPEKPEPKERPPPQPKPFAVYAKEKADINLPINDANHYEEPGKKSDKPTIVPRDRSRSQENLEESEEPGGDIYQNVASVKVILATDLEEYVKDKKRGQTNELAQEFSLISVNQIHPWTVASKEKNKPKNRFRNIIAYDHSRVVIEKVDGDPHSDYYNANYINDFRGDRVFIASQAPNTASLTAFWRMLWQENVATIIMVTNLIESGKDRCRQYWPKNPRTVEVIGDFSLFLVETEQFSDHIVRTVMVKRTGDGLDDDDADEEKRTITQYHYLSWPDMGVPEHYTTLINFTESVKKHHRRLQSAGHESPMLVHCSAGVGRTGTFICLYNMLDMMREEGKIDIFGFVSKMRDNRFKMVQTKEQYIFLYNALLEVYLSGDTEIPVAKFREKMNTLHRANSVTKKENIQVEFETLHALTPTPAANSFRSGRASINQKKNRFPDILPLERNRPYLASAGFADSTDFINASFMNTFLKKDVFLATQSPLPNTVVDLWRLVFDWKCPVIVMLNESDRDDCVQYWPEEGSIAFGSLEVTALESESTMNFVKRNLSLSNDFGESMTIEHFEMLGWGMSHNKPDSPLSLIKLIEAVEGSIKKAESKGPAIVHCINGIGRSGVFCALWSIMEKLRKDNTIDIFQAVKRLRSSRPNMVETLDQYELCYDVVNQHLHQFEEYANLDVL